MPTKSAQRFFPTGEPQPKLGIGTYSWNLSYAEPAFLALGFDPRKRVPYHATLVRHMASSEPIIASIVITYECRRQM